MSVLETTCQPSTGIALRMPKRSLLEYDSLALVGSGAGGGALPRNEINIFRRHPPGADSLQHLGDLAPAVQSAAPHAHSHQIIKAKFSNRSRQRRREKKVHRSTDAENAPPPFISSLETNYASVRPPDSIEVVKDMRALLEKQQGKEETTISKGSSYASALTGADSSRSLGFLGSLGNLPLENPIGTRKSRQADLIGVEDVEKKGSKWIKARDLKSKARGRTRQHATSILTRRRIDDTQSSVLTSLPTNTHSAPLNRVSGGNGQVLDVLCRLGMAKTDAASQVQSYSAVSKATPTDEIKMSDGYDSLAALTTAVDTSQFNRSPSVGKLIAKRSRALRSPPIAIIRSVLGGESPPSAASSTRVGWGSPSPRPKPFKRRDKKKTPDKEKLLGNEKAAVNEERKSQGPLQISVVVSGGDKDISSATLRPPIPCDADDVNAVATRLFDEVHSGAIPSPVAQPQVKRSHVSGSSVTEILLTCPSSRAVSSTEKKTVKLQERVSILPVLRRSLRRKASDRRDTAISTVSCESKVLSVEEPELFIRKKEKNISGEEKTNRKRLVRNRRAKKKKGPPVANKSKRRGKGRERGGGKSKLSARENKNNFKDIGVKWREVDESINSGGSDVGSSDDVFAAYEEMCVKETERKKNTPQSPGNSPVRDRRKKTQNVRPQSRGRKKKTAAEIRNKTKESSSPTLEWTREHIQSLRKAHHSVAPTSFSFWEDVADQLDGKTSEECRNKWFSLVQTPARKQRAKRDANTKSREILGEDEKETIDDKDDDLFNSTPFRPDTQFHDGTDDELSGVAELDEDVELPCDFESPIAYSAKKVSNDDRKYDSDNGRSPLLFRKGYKGYIKGLAKIRKNADEKNRRARGGRSGLKMTSKLGGKAVFANIGAGDVQMNAILTPGGTVQVQAPEESDLADLIIRPGDEFSDDEAKENAVLAMD